MKCDVWCHNVKLVAFWHECSDNYHLTKMGINSTSANNYLIEQFILDIHVFTNFFSEITDLAHWIVTLCTVG